MSVIGTIVGVLVFLTIVGTAVNDAFGDSEVTVDESTAVASGDEEEPVATDLDEPAEDESEAGTRENPLPLGSTIESDEWSIVVHEVRTGVADEISAANQFNEPAEDGTEYILINYSATYIGDDPAGSIPAWVSVNYVTADGVTVDPTDAFVVAPDEIDTMSTLYEGGTASGNAALQVPSPVDGVIAVGTEDLLADPIFIAIQ